MTVMVHNMHMSIYESLGAYTFYMLDVYFFMQICGLELHKCPCSIHATNSLSKVLNSMSAWLLDIMAAHWMKSNPRLIIEPPLTFFTESPDGCKTKRSEWNTETIRDIQLSKNKQWMNENTLEWCNMSMRRPSMWPSLHNCYVTHWSVCIFR